MRFRCGTAGMIAVVSVMLGCASEASAQFGQLQRALFRGAEFAGNNLFLSNPQGGPLFDFNVFRQRLEFNRAGQGYTYESFRFFGPDSFGNTNTLDLGMFKIELGADPAVVPSGQPVGVHNRVGYTTTFIPEVFFDAQTGQRTFNQFSGITTFAPVPINYRVSLNAGIQDVEWRGNALIDASGRINLLGFYDFDLQFTNVGNFESDGVFIHDEQVTDFDVGPIDISGNILFDIIASLLQADGAAGAAVPARIYSGAAQRDKTIDDLLLQIDAGESLTEAEIQFLAGEMFSSAFRSDPLGVLINGMPSEVAGFGGLSLEVLGSAGSGNGAGANASGAPVPEPGTLVLLASVAGAMAVLRPFRRRRS